MTIVLFQIFFAYRDTSLAFAMHSFSLSLDPQEMSLNIDINTILPVTLVSHLISTVNFLTSSLSCNVVNPVKYSIRNSIGSPSILSEFL